MSKGSDQVREDEEIEIEPPADRKRARLARPSPVRQHRYADVELADLRRMRSALADEEMRVSYWRRIFQARLDMLQAQSPVTEVSIEPIGWGRRYLLAFVIRAIEEIDIHPPIAVIVKYCQTGTNRFNDKMFTRTAVCVQEINSSLRCDVLEAN